MTEHMMPDEAVFARIAERGLQKARAGDLSGARSDVLCAVAARPDWPDIWRLKSALDVRSDDLDEARISIRRAVLEGNRNPKVLSDYAGLMATVSLRRASDNQWPGGRSAAVSALLLEPGLSEAWFALGLVDDALGNVDGVVRDFERVSLIDPDNSLSRYWSGLAVPKILRTKEEIDVCRSRFLKNLRSLMARGGTVDDPAAVLGTGYFFLAYHGLADRAHVEGLAALLRSKCPGLGYEAGFISRWESPERARRKIRFGIISQHLFGHTIGRLNRGLIRNFDRDRFEVTVLHAPASKVDEMRASIDRLADNAVVLPADLAQQQEAVAALELDVLLYLDIGMGSFSYLLAHARLAPVQAVAWGHPDTTGLPTVDYFLSSDAIEPDGAEAHYTETLIRLPRLPCVFEADTIARPSTDREGLGLPAAGRLYGCPQSLFKFHPDFDAVLAGILDLDPDAWIVAIESDPPEWMDILRRRWQHNFPGLAERVVFLPRLSADRFASLLSAVDVLLDPPHFGSGLTMYEAMVHGTPIVTWPGSFMRARIVAAAYRQMAVADAPVVERLTDFARVAVSLASDPLGRERLRASTASAARDRLFDDVKFARHVEVFASAAMRAADQGNKLGDGWRIPNDVREA